MPRCLPQLRLACAGLLLTLATALQAAALQVTDDRGVTVRWDAPPQRIVSLLPSLTESLCELGQCQRLIGVDRYSNWPAAIDGLPRLGGGIDPNLEAIVAMKPDAVVMAQSSPIVARLEALGLKVLALEPRSHADVRRVLAQLARLTGMDEAAAQRIWRQIDAAVSAAAQSLPPGASRTRVYFEASRGQYAAGPSSFIGETLARLGVRNVVPPDQGPFP
jgi:iron complex transport system substrate-binding protein